jgi:hypothetical protein
MLISRWVIYKARRTVFLFIEKKFFLNFDSNEFESKGFYERALNKTFYKGKLFI